MAAVRPNVACCASTRQGGGQAGTNRSAAGDGDRRLRLHLHGNGGCVGAAVGGCAGDRVGGVLLGRGHGDGGTGLTGAPAVGVGPRHVQRGRSTLTNDLRGGRGGQRGEVHRELDVVIEGGVVVMHHVDGGFVAVVSVGLCDGERGDELRFGLRSYLRNVVTSNRGGVVEGRASAVVEDRIPTGIVGACRLVCGELCCIESVQSGAVRRAADGYGGESFVVNAPKVIKG